MTPNEHWILMNAKCSAQYENSTEPGFCSAVWDRYLCWPPTPPGQMVTFRCPPSKGIDTSKFATRTCRLDGLWQWKEIPGRDFGTNNFTELQNYGWTNYSQCFPPGIRKLLDILNSQSDDVAEQKIMAAEGTRILEMVGLSVSMISLLISLLIFRQFPTLRNSRTRIHANLFIAMSIQVLVRLIVYSDQYISRSVSIPLNNLNSSALNSNFEPSFIADGAPGIQSIITERKGIEDREYLCEIFYILLEYARTAMFCWMFVEGLHLHNMITVSVFQEKISMQCLWCIGWLSPACLTIVWAIVTFNKFRGITCWWGYNLSPYFWILEGPRLTVIILNLGFLLNIVRVLVTKLRESRSSEAQKVRKAVRAAIVLLPLLGITNSIQMIHSPVDLGPILFAIWAYFTAFLTSFQGFFCSLIYCFLNGEVQVSIRRGLRARLPHRQASGIQLKSRAKITIDEGMNLKLDPVKFKVKENSEILNRALPKCRDHIQEYWHDIAMTAHQVHVEHIEIPEDLYIRHGGKINASKCETINQSLINNSVSTSSTSSLPVENGVTEKSPETNIEIPKVLNEVSNFIL